MVCVDWYDVVGSCGFFVGFGGYCLGGIFVSLIEGWVVSVWVCVGEGGCGGVFEGNVWGLI